VPLKTYDESLNFFRTSLDAAKVGDKKKIEGFSRLEKFARNVEKRMNPTVVFDKLIAHENKISKSLGGRSVFDGQPPRVTGKRQLSLF
jgi:hypothetical protein